MSGLTTERTARMRPSATSSDQTANGRPSPSTTTAPGWPLTTSGRSESPPIRRPAVDPGDQRPRDALAAVDRASEGGHLAAAVAVQHDVLGQQLLEPRQVALAGGGQEAPRQLVARLLRGLVARAALLHVAPRPRRELAGVGLAGADDRRDLGRRGSRTPRAAGTRPAARARGSRARPGRPATASRRARPARRARPRRRRPAARAATRRRSDSRRARAERSSSMLSRVTTAATQAGGESIRSPAARARCRRSRASCTTSSASLALPSMRYATANARGRSSS